MYKTIEITLPISPSQCIFLNRQGFSGYIEVNESVVKDLNRTNRFHASNYYIMNQNKVDEDWFNPGIEPEDSWEKEQQRKEAKKL